MRLTRCPICHSHIDLMSLIEDDAGKSLLIETTKLNPSTAPAILAYVSLFKPAKSDLNNARALKLLKETLALTDDKQLLANACEVTVQAVRSKGGKTLKNHRYLVAVLESQTNQQPITAIATINQLEKTLNNTEWANNLDDVL